MCWRLALSRLELLAMPKRGRGGRTALKDLGKPEGSEETIQVYDGPYDSTSSRARSMPPCLKASGRCHAGGGCGTAGGEGLCQEEQPQDHGGQKSSAKKAAAKTAAKKPPATTKSGRLRASAADQTCRQLMLRLVWLLPRRCCRLCRTPEELQRSWSPRNARPPRRGTDPRATSGGGSAPIDRSQVVDEEAATKSDTDTDTDGIDVQQPISKSLQPPAPYRITIRFGADPAVPAEAVTRALRQSEVVFSVERIERITP